MSKLPATNSFKSSHGPLYLASLPKNGVFAGEYIIQPGDTLSSIASKLNTTVANLLMLNPDITNPDMIIAGKSLKY